MKVTAVAHPIQGLIKYHGLRDFRQRIPYHDSISVCVKALTTKTTVEPDPGLQDDIFIVNGRPATEDEASRIKAVLNRLRGIARSKLKFRVFSQNSLTAGKGLGFSASAFASLGLAASEALNLKLDPRELCEIVRLGAGSATRSLVGGFAIWYSNKRGRSYAEQLAPPDHMDLRMLVVPLSMDVKTDEAHEEVLGSPLFQARLKYVRHALKAMKRAIRERDVRAICELAERDTLNLHAVTMTGRKGLVLMSPESLRLISLVRELRLSEGIPAWFSLDTGPSVFINTYQEHAKEIAIRVASETGHKAIESQVGPGAYEVQEHLF